MSTPATADQIRHIVETYADRPEIFGRSLAKALDWQTDRAQPEKISNDRQDGLVVRGYVGAQPATIFVVGSGEDRCQLLNAAALYAYHASIEWGLVVDASEATLFNSHWVLSNQWFSLPPLHWKALEDRHEVLEAITPEGLTSGRIERVASRYREPDRLLVPVDDALVDRLDHWREEALRHSRQPLAIDEILQTTFAQLFVLRAIEDRALAPSVGSLLSVCTSREEVDHAQLKLLFERAQKEIESELFDFHVITAIPEFVLAGIIRDLYTPRDLPGSNLRYNFAWIDADVLGRAYEKYLSTLLMPVPITSPQLRIWRQPVQDAERISVQKARGVYYTPPQLVRYLTERCLAHLDSRINNATELPRIADFSCGSGSFLTSAADYLLRRLREKDPKRNWVQELMKDKCIVGIDIDSRAVTLARLSLWLRFAEEPNPLPLPRLKEVVVQGDALGEDVWESLPEFYDVILGNPPFLAATAVQDRNELATRYQTARGRFDYSYLFVELALRRLKEGGVLGMVVPNRLFRNRDASGLRQILTTAGNLLTLVDFGVPELFEGATAYIGAMVAEKAERGEDGKVRVIKVAKIPSRFLGVLLMQSDVRGSSVAPEYLNTYDASISQGMHPWLLLSPSERRARVRLSEVSQELGNLASVFQGIRTGANDIFVVEVISGGAGGVVQVRNGLGDTAIIETTLLRPLVFGADIGRYARFSRVEDAWQRYLLYPYGEKGVIPEAELREYYPFTYEYLRAYQGLLSDRTSLSSGSRWYELIRKREERRMAQKKLMTRDLAARPSFAIDTEGAVYLVGGTAVVPSDPDHLLPLLGYLNSSVADWFLTQVTPVFKDGFQKIEPQHLQSLPVPSGILETGETQDQLTRLVEEIIEARARGDEPTQEGLEAAVDSLLQELVGLKSGEVE